ncbi:MAG: putative lipid II flippase FtsW [Deltaproteobacteria bacterium]
MYGNHFGKTKNGPDTILLVATLFLALLGTIMVFSSSHRVAEVKYQDVLFFLKKQLIFVSCGIVLMIVFARFSHQKIRKFIYPAIAISIFLLLLVFVPGIGRKVNGAARWLRLGPISLHVGEMVKLVVVVFLADYLARKTEVLKELKRGLIVPLLVILPLATLIIVEPDFGTVAIIFAVMLLMLFVGGANGKHLGALASFAVAGGIALLIAAPYRMSRVMAFRNPWENPETTGFQIVQSVVSYGSGGAFGVGVGDGMQKLFFLPEAHTDFILSIIAEESGLIGVSVVLILFSIIFIRGCLIAVSVEDRFSSLLAIGITLLITIQAIINIAGSMGLIPPKGLALPFVSYGGTALVVNMIAIGILLNVSTMAKGNSIKKIFATFTDPKEDMTWQRRTKI